MSEIANPNATRPHPSKRFGLLEAGDGLQYQVLRLGTSARSIELRVLLSEWYKLVNSEGTDENLTETSKVSQSIFMGALTPYYQAETIQELLDQDLLGDTEFRDLLKILNGTDLLPQAEKKSSAEKT